MNSIIEEICERMKRYPHAGLEHDDSSVTYHPSSPSGFIVQLIVRQGGSREHYWIYYGGCRQEMAQQACAIVTFGFGLSTGCRLRVYSRGRRPYHWIIDLWYETSWKADWETYDFSSVFWHFWRRPKVHCLQNRLIDLNDGGAAAAACAVLVATRPPTTSFGAAQARPDAPGSA